MTYRTLLMERAGAIATLTLNRPDARNAIDMTMREELLDALEHLEADARLRVLVLRGAGGHFCAGGDMKSLRERPPQAEEHLQRVRALNRVMLKLARFERPTVAVVDGFALGSGWALALACDLIVASDRARFGLAFLKVGLVPDAGTSWMLPRLLGSAAAKRLVFTSELVPAQDALAMGLITTVVPEAELDAETARVAQRLAEGPPNALAAAKRLIDTAATRTLAEALEAEAIAQATAVTGGEHREGLAALFEKRPPRF